MTKPVKMRTFGGVKVPRRAVKSFKKSSKNGTTHFIIDFKNGIKIEYPAQKASNNSKIRVFKEKNKDGSISPGIYVGNMAWATVTGSNKDDCIGMIGCNHSTVDVYGPGSDRVAYMSSNKFKSHDNKTVQDLMDSSKVFSGGYISTSYGPGIHYEDGTMKTFDEK